MAEANVEQEASKFLDKVGDEDKKDPKKLASKLYAVRDVLPLSATFSANNS